MAGTGCSGDGDCRTQLPWNFYEEGNGLVGMSVGSSAVGKLLFPSIPAAMVPLLPVWQHSAGDSYSGHMGAGGHLPLVFQQSGSCAAASGIISHSRSLLSRLPAYCCSLWPACCSCGFTAACWWVELQGAGQASIHTGNAGEAGMDQVSHSKQGVSSCWGPVGMGCILCFCLHAVSKSALSIAACSVGGPSGQVTPAVRVTPLTGSELGSSAPSRIA